MHMLTGCVATFDVRQAKPAPKKADPFYVSPEWRALVASEIVRRFGNKANTHCEDRACLTPHYRGIRVIGHHIRERSDGGAGLDRANVKFLCYPCHARVTAAAARARMHARA